MISTTMIVLGLAGLAGGWYALNKLKKTAYARSYYVHPAYRYYGGY